MRSITGALPWNSEAGGLFDRGISSIIYLPNYKLLKSACVSWIETKGRFWKKLIFSVINGRQVFPGLIQKIKVRFLLSCSLHSLLLEEVKGEKTYLTEVSTGEFSFQDFLSSLNLCVSIFLHFLVLLVLTSLCTYPPLPRDT